MLKGDMLRKLGVGRRQPSDPFFAEGDLVCRAYKREGIIEIDDEDLCHDIVAKFPCHVVGCSLEFDSVLQFEMHYNSSHRYHCSECRKRLPSPHLLDLHVSETHDSFFLAQAQRKPMYRCYVEECEAIFATPQERHGHCIEVHQFPHDFRFDDTRKQKTRQSNKKHGKKGLSGCVKKGNVIAGDSKSEISSGDQNLKTAEILMMPQASETLNEPTGGEKMDLGEAVAASEGREVWSGKSWSFGRGRARFQIGRDGNKNKKKQTSSSWDTSTLMDALNDVPSAECLMENDSQLNDDVAKK